MLVETWIRTESTTYSLFEKLLPLIRMSTVALYWTLQALIDGHENIQPDNFQRQRLIEILRLLLDSGLRFEPKPAQPRIKSTDLQIFLSSGQLLTLGERVSIPILDVDV